MKPYKRPHNEPVKDAVKETEALYQVVKATATEDGVRLFRAIAPPKRNGRDAGFTFVEVMMTCAILAILSAVAVPSYTRRIENTRIKATVENTETLNTCVHDLFLQEQAEETTFRQMGTDRFNEIANLLRGGSFDDCNVTGYTLDLNGLDNCYMSIVAFRGVTPETLYTKID